jgi:hypothetical protein
MDLIDIDAALVRELVRAVVQQQLMQVTGRLDVGAPARRPQPTRAAEPVLTLAEETPRERQERWYREAAIAFRTIDNSVYASLAGR